MNSASLEQWLVHLEALHPTEMELGLGRVTEVANTLGLLPYEIPVVTVAGTNGKGSTVAVLSALLGECGKSTGSFTSPHFQRFNERIRVAGCDAGDDEIATAFAAIEAARGQISLTYFEFATLAALLVFRRREVDVCILEVGLGGRLDSVNIIDTSVAIITSIDLDHQQWLGETRGEIAREKAGIMRRGRPVVIADPAPPTELLACAQEVGAQPVYLLGREFSYTVSDSGWTGFITSSNGKQSIFEQSSDAVLPQNVCAGLQAASLLGVSFTPAQVAGALSKVDPVGRRQALELAGKHYLLDVAHNPAAANKLLEKVGIRDCNKRTIALFSAMKDKAIVEMLEPAASSFDAWFLAEQPDNKRAMPAKEIAQLLRSQGQQTVSISENIPEAFRLAQQSMSDGDTLVVFGSFYTVAGVLPLLDKDRSKHGSC